MLWACAGTVGSYQCETWRKNRAARLRCATGAGSATVDTRIHHATGFFEPGKASHVDKAYSCYTADIRVRCAAAEVANAGSVFMLLRGPAGEIACSLASCYRTVERSKKTKRQSPWTQCRPHFILLPVASHTNSAHSNNLMVRAVSCPRRGMSSLGRQPSSRHITAPAPSFGAGSSRPSASTTPTAGQTGDVRTSFLKSSKSKRGKAAFFPGDTTRHKHDKLWGRDPPTSPGES